MSSSLSRCARVQRTSRSAQRVTEGSERSRRHGCQLCVCKQQGRKTGVFDQATKYCIYYICIPHQSLPRENELVGSKRHHVSVAAHRVYMQSRKIYLAYKDLEFPLSTCGDMYESQGTIKVQAALFSVADVNIQIRFPSFFLSFKEETKHTHAHTKTGPAKPRAPSRIHRAETRLLTLTKSVPLLRKEEVSAHRFSLIYVRT